MATSHVDLPDCFTALYKRVEVGMIALVFACCLVCSASVDTLYTVDFSTQPPDWIPGTLWEWQTDCINLYMDVAESWMYVSEEDSLLSPEIAVPATFDSLAVVFDHWYWTHGHWIAPGEWAKTTMSLSMNCSSSPASMVLWELVFVGGRSSFIRSDSGLISIPITGILPGDTLQFTFRGVVEAEALFLHAADTLDWNLYSFSVLGYGQEGLRPATWAAIKAAF